ncbi:hypothetical protein [Paraburkholderia phytofirmans]|uniref:Uncharacterized protein n=1 Tax=Paraburkholderia phytofirmans TaxID=261302 RepID=A0ABW9BR97_9BURK
MPDQQKNEAIYDEQVHAAACVRLDGYPYLIETPDGQMHAGRLDAYGQLSRIDARESSDDYTVYWGDKARACDDMARIQYHMEQDTES